jgi:hypothetical protein
MTRRKPTLSQSPDSDRHNCTFRFTQALGFYAIMILNVLFGGDPNPSVMSPFYPTHPIEICGVDGLKFPCPYEMN